MRIVWSATAIANLVEIRQYIEQDKPEAASRLAKRIVQSVDRFSKHPHLGRPGREPETRELIVAGSPTSFRIKFTEAASPFSRCCTRRKIDRTNSHCTVCSSCAPDLAHMRPWL